MMRFYPSNWITIRQYSVGRDVPDRCPRCGSDALRVEEDLIICHWCDYRWRFPIRIW